LNSQVTKLSAEQKFMFKSNILSGRTMGTGHPVYQ